MNTRLKIRTIKKWKCVHTKLRQIKWLTFTKFRILSCKIAEAFWKCVAFLCYKICMFLEPDNDTLEKIIEQNK